MSLIKSISGIRGTIGGRSGEALTPIDIVKFSAAYAEWIIRRKSFPEFKIVVGRDARTTGELVSNVVISTLRSLGIEVTDLGMATTPTVEVAVTGTGSSGGIIITASHNPANWNALKLLNERGEFLSAADGNEVLAIAGNEDFNFVTYDKTGIVSSDATWGSRHIEMVLALKHVDAEAIRSAELTVAVDCVNSVGSLVIPGLLENLGVKKYYLLNGTPDGHFAHNPEPLPENLTGIASFVREKQADVGFVVDPDVDRLAIINEDGSMFGEEYTLVAVSDYILNFSRGNTVSNMSSTRALKDITEKHGGNYFTSAVGEVNVVEEMKARHAVIGGEGNGGVIYPELHYGRDALVGIALFLSHLAKSKMKCSGLRKTYPEYFITKRKLTLQPGTDIDKILDGLKVSFSGERLDLRDGLRIDYETGWVQIRKSNTEPVIRIYAEGRTVSEAGKFADIISSFVKET
ncbi:MAG TPA: phosphoglucosamine mutase [Bacteroidales bacterium]|nr:phosphoglucosamine mutase [Bacteroidales bacterium]